MITFGSLNKMYMEYMLISMEDLKWTFRWYGEPLRLANYNKAGMSHLSIETS